MYYVYFYNKKVKEIVENLKKNTEIKNRCYAIEEL